jgi:hypothetical protein
MVKMGVGEPVDTVASIENKRNPSQVVYLLYLRGENAFVTFGIEEHFAEKEIMIPAYLLVKDFELVGSIISAILERLSEAKDMGGVFVYEPRFTVLGTTYSLTEYKGFMLMEPIDGGVGRELGEMVLPIPGGLD